MVFFAAALFVALSLAVRAGAHDFPCGHDHIEGPAGQVFLENICTGEAANCSAGCSQISTRNGQTYCSCAQGDCETAFAATFVPREEGPLAANEKRTFTLSTETLEALSVLVEEMEVASFGPTVDDTFGPADADAVDGFVTLEFGSFDVPEAVPVKVSRLFIELVSLAGGGKESGINSVELRDGEPILMLYDVGGNRFRMAAEEEMAIGLELENDLAGQQPAVMYFEGKFDEDGNLVIFGQLAVNIFETALSWLSWGHTKILFGSIDDGQEGQ